jgi:hypothetical protein
MSLSLPPVFFAANIIEIFERCGTVDKTIVVGLALFSLVAWTVLKRICAISGRCSICRSRIGNAA